MSTSRRLWAALIAQRHRAVRRVRRLRAPGDTIFAVGSLLITRFAARRWIAPRRVAHPLQGRGAESYG